METMEAIIVVFLLNTHILLKRWIGKQTLSSEVDTPSSMPSILTLVTFGIWTLGVLDFLVIIKVKTCIWVSEPTLILDDLGLNIHMWSFLWDNNMIIIFINNVKDRIFVAHFSMRNARNTMVARRTP